MQLFEANRSHFLKIFETHQFKGLISFTDILKICSSLKVFPDLIDSQEVQKIFSSVSSGNFYKITYLEFENFLKSLAGKLFGNSGDMIDCLEIFLAHIRSFALKAYGTDIKTFLGKHRSLSKGLKSSKQLSLSSIKNKSVVKIPETTRNNKSKKSLFDMNPGIIQLKKKKLKKMKENIDEGQVEDRVKKVFDDFKSKDLGKKWISRRKMGRCVDVVSVGRARVVLMKMWFQMWKLSVM